MRFDPKKRRYVDSRGRVMTAQQVRKEVEDYIESEQKKVDSKAAQVLAGTIDLAAFFAWMDNRVETWHKVSGAIAYGGKAQMNPERWARVDKQIESEKEFLKKFATESILATITEEGLATRAGMYAEAAYSTYENNVAQREQDSGAIGARRICENDPASCDECIEAATEDYLSLSEVADIGTLTCLNNCVVAGTLMSGRFTGGFRTLYAGEIVNLRTASGRRLSITPNHPVLTNRGFVSAGNLEKGDSLACESGHIHPASTINNHQKPPTAIDEIFSALAKFGWLGRLRSRAVDFHGDARFTQGDIEIVATDSILLNHRPSLRNQGRRQLIFKSPAHGLRILATLTSERQVSVGSFDSSNSAPSSRGLNGGDLQPFLPRQRFGLTSVADSNPSSLEGSPERQATDSHLAAKSQKAFAGDISLRGTIDVDSFVNQICAAGYPQRLTFGNCANVDVALDKPAAEDPSSDAVFMRELWERFPGFVTSDPIVEIERDGSGSPRHVYDLSTDVGWQSANGIIIANCRCYYEFNYEGVEPLRIDETVNTIFARSEAVQ